MAVGSGKRRSFPYAFFYFAILAKYCVPPIQYWCAIYNFLSFVFLCFFCEETNWNRDHSASEDVTEYPPNSGLGGNGVQTPNVDVDIKIGQEVKANQSDLDIELSVEQGQTSYTKKTFWSKMKLISQNNSNHVDIGTIRGQVTRPLLYLQLPVVVFCGISVGCYQMWLSFLNGTESTVMSGTYNISTGLLGVPYLSPIVFSIFG